VLDVVINDFHGYKNKELKHIWRNDIFKIGEI